MLPAVHNKETKEATSYLLRFMSLDLMSVLIPGKYLRNPENVTNVYLFTSVMFRS